MKKIIYLLTLTLLIIGCGDYTSKLKIVIEDINIIDVRTGRIIDNQNIVIEEGIIISIVSTLDEIDIHENDQVIDGKNKYVIPGLWDMHVHLTDATELALPMLVSYGILGVRDMGGDLTVIDSMVKNINIGNIVGPKIFRAGNYVDGEKPGLPYRITLSDKKDAVIAVYQLKSDGVDFIKVHNLVPRESYFELLKEAKSQNLKVAGHIPVNVTPKEASNAGQYSFEHMNTLVEGTFMAQFTNQLEMLEGIKQFVNSDSDDLINTMKKNNTWMTPNLLSIKARAEKGKLNKTPDKRLIYIAKSLREQWDVYFPVSEKDSNPVVVNARQEYLNLMMLLTTKMQKSKIGLLAGSDLALRDVYPGSGLHDELVLLVDAGLTPLEALQTATINPAIFLKIENEYGTVEGGKRAALIILEDNPLTDINNIKKIDFVINGMMIHDDESINRMREEVALNTIEH